MYGRTVRCTCSTGRCHHRGKWTPNNEGPYVVKRVFSGGALMLTTMEGEDFPSPVNSDAVKKYFA